MILMRRFLSPLIGLFCWVPVIAWSDSEQASQAQGQATTLTELLESVRDDTRDSNRRNAERLQRFSGDRDRQRQLLDTLEAELGDAEQRSLNLSTRFEGNEAALQDLQERLDIRIGNFGELFGVARQMSAETQGLLERSLVSAQMPDRGEAASKIAQSRELPSIEDLKALQVLLLEEMVESSRVVRFDAQFSDAKGVLQSGEVVRVGTFALVHKDRFLEYQPQSGAMQALSRQPASRFRSQAEDLFDASEGPVAMAIDPTRGQLLSLLIQTPTLIERLQQGREVGYAIIAMGVLGLGIALWRLLYLYRTRRAVQSQLGSTQPDLGNPLGRILATYENNRHKELDALSLALDEAIMRETPALERFQGIIKVFAALAPLLGLLGTVVGMILTFQQLTLFGTGDPKLMAGGISQALMTTVLGLTAAIPLILLHSLVSSTSRGLVEVLEEQSVGLIARRADTQA